MKKFIILMIVKILLVIAVVGGIVYFSLNANAAELKAYEGEDACFSLKHLSRVKTIESRAVSRQA